MTLQRLFKERLAVIEDKELSKRLGYRTTAKVMVRVDEIINSRYLGLDKSGFDLRYSTPELVRKLAEVLSIPALLCDTVIEEIQAELLAENNKFSPYIFIETDFKRKSEPVFMLAALQSQRYLPIEEKTQSLSLNEQLDVVSQQIKVHYQQQTSLKLWGEIQKYVFNYNESSALQFSTKGELLEAVEDYVYSKATLTI